MNPKQRDKETFVQVGDRLLEARTAAILKGSATERIDWLYNSPRDIRYTRLQDDVLKNLVKCIVRESQIRRRCRVILGPANNGKSTTLKILEDMFAATRGEGPADIVPFIRVDAPVGPNADALLRDLLEAAWGIYERRRATDPHRFGSDIPIEPPFNTRPHLLERQFIHLARNVGLRGIGIDDIENSVKGGSTASAALMIRLKRLSNVIPCAVIATGTADAAPAIDADTSTQTRFKALVLPRWVDDDQYRRLLAHVEAYLPLRKASNLSADESAHLVLDMTSGLLGEIMELLIDTAEHAIETGVEQITPKLLRQFGSVSENSISALKRLQDDQEHPDA